MRAFAAVAAGLSLVCVTVVLWGVPGIAAQTEAESAAPLVRDGVFIHITKGQSDPHAVLMGLKMACLMAETRDVLVYFDVKGIEVVLQDAEALALAPFPSSHEALATLRSGGVRVLACPGCLSAAGKTPADLREGIEVAHADAFFDFTKGRILTLDY